MRKWFLRILVYIAALLVLALGITLNVKTGLGVSPIISVAHVFSVILSVQIGNTTFVLYTVFVLAQMAMHLVMYRRDRSLPLASLLAKDALQLPLSLVFTRVMNIFEAVIPQMDMLPEGMFFSGFAGRILALLAAIILTGIGAAASLDMRLVPNPGDGIVQTIGDLAGKETGLVKNIFDGCNVVITLTLGFVFTGSVVSIGIGTIIAFLGVGRVVSLFNRIFLPGLSRLAGNGQK